MSLEAAIKENTEALSKLLTATERLIGLRTEAVETVKAAAAPAPAAAKAAKPKDAPPAAEEPKANISATPEDRQPSASATDLEDAAMKHPLGKLIIDYVKNGYPEDHPQAAQERAARLQKVKALYGAISEALTKAKGTPVTIASFTDIPEANHAQIIKKLEDFIAAPALVITAAAAPAELEI
jgi:hypothetical protein